MSEWYKHAKNNSSPRVVDYLCFVQLQWSCVLADVALADVALKAWYMRLQSTKFSEIVQCQHFSRHPVCHVVSGLLLVNISQLI